MLAQLLDQAGRPALALPLDPSLQHLTAIVEPDRSDVFCLSAVPPFAFAHARTLSRLLQVRFPRIKIVIGVWGFSGDTEKALQRFQPKRPDKLVTSLGDAVAYFAGSTPASKDNRSPLLRRCKTRRKPSLDRQEALRRSQNSAAHLVALPRDRGSDTHRRRCGNDVARLVHLQNNMKILKPFPSALAVLLVGTLAGCSASATKSPEVSDSIRKSLDLANFKDVSVTQDREKGVVTLAGHVAAEGDKAQAESIAKSMAGDQVVSNQIAVIPAASASDAKKVNSDLDQGIEKNVDAALIQSWDQKGREVRGQEWRCDSDWRGWF